MPHLYSAQKTPTQVAFEVCDADPGQCVHEDPGQAHRLYTWTNDGNPMTVTQMLKEVKLLEAHRAATLDTGTPLPQSGQAL